MSVRLVSSAKSLREQFRAAQSNGNSTMPSNSAVAHTPSNGVSRSKTLRPPIGAKSPSRQNTLLRTSSGGNLRRAKSIQKKGLISKVFADEEVNPHEALPDLSMEVTSLIVKRCIKEIRERGLATKGILRQVQMAQSQKVIIDTIRIILDDDASTELSPLHQIDIHLVAHAMKWAIRYSEQILVTYEDYQSLYVEQDRNFTKFAHNLPPTNRAILLDLFSLCADVTLLAHLNNMTLVAVAKAISLSIMAGPEREFTTFDASLQQRNLWGAACEDLLRAFLRIKTTYDLAKIDQEDEVDENRYICNETRVLKSARQSSRDIGHIPNSINLPSGHDISLPSSTGSSLPGSAGWRTPGAGTPQSYATNHTGYFDMVVPRPGSPLSQSSAMYGASPSQPHLNAKPTFPVSAPIALPSVQHIDDITEYEELMQDQSHLNRLRSDRNSMLRPAEPMRRRSSVTDMESLYMLPVEVTSPVDGYESDPEVSHAHEEDPNDSLTLDFADGLNWDFSKHVDMTSNDAPSLTSFQSQPCGASKHVSRSNNANGLGMSSPAYTPSPQGLRNHLKQQSPSTHVGHSQGPPAYQNYPLSLSIPPQGSIQRVMSPTRARINQAVAQNYPSRTSPSFRPHHSRRNSAIRRSISMNPAAAYSYIHRRPEELQADILAHDLAVQLEKDLVVNDIRFQLLQVKNADHQDPARASSAFSLHLSPLDLERGSVVSSRRGSSISANDRPKSMIELNTTNLPPQYEEASTSATEPVSADELKPTEAITRPTEVSIMFAPIPTMAPLSPRSEMKSKFHESFPERPVSPPSGYRGTASADASRRSMTNTIPKSSHSQKRPVSSTSTKIRPSLRQSATFSGAPISSQSSNSDSKSRTSGFIRALSFKLRSKHSDDQLKAAKSNQEVGAVPMPTPSVSFEPPRLELSFMNDGLGPTELSFCSNSEDQLPSTAAPAPFQSGSGSETLENCKQFAQSPIPIQSDNVNSNPTVNGMQQQQHRELHPAGFTGIRRKSEVLLSSSSSQSIRKELQKPKSGPILSVKSLQQSHSTAKDSDDDNAKAKESKKFSGQSETPATSTESIIPKTDVVEKELSFSTATLLKDGKLYYQLRWNQFSEIGFKSDYFIEPTQLHQLQLSQEGPQQQQHQWQHQWQQDSDHMRILSASLPSPTLELPGQLGQEQAQNQQRGPSQAQRAAAMKVARESFLAVASDPEALAALKAESARRNGQAMIISSGTFAKDSIMPQLDLFPHPPTITSKSIASPQQVQQIYPSPNLSPNGSLKSARSIDAISATGFPAADGEGRDSVQRSMSDRPSATGGAPFSPSKTITKPGTAVVGGGGHGSSVSSSPGARYKRQHKRTASATSDVAAVAVKSKGRNKLFGRKSKKLANLYLSGSTTSLASALPTTIHKSNSGGRKRRLFPVGVKRQDVMTRTIESMDEVFPWMCIEHMAGQESGWVMLEPVQDRAVGWVMVDRLEDERISAAARAIVPQASERYDQREELMSERYQPLQPKTAMQAQVA
ncbi:hypothetical protein BX616_005792 [Lobosporangium transversale]|uniref:Rho-GAP domain-containing protein n=1 Tax=Lobosporangium transversale TaxID=64571 RepID=A0A1Y2GF27_9FUNG|nr:hypothetical protein BCR41DRAFT_398928 [Lobosporangium transversale]KAF9915595.1 hypothetical protein BX616_005792 [Lobosporangium transversale]ORZ09056.1 hypothetical protein BCR41DRAFT_398928 [Lobosporangium transversale]|eukprot:XP_021878683.1 hypothetical protein BCR41DRAFT_398928 [Lobosporangium transversale]